ncbi:aminotransferase class I/II-fold pyridoxal phosphate-dependent enzyme [Bacteroides ovatus]|uniref:aminotransferase class I/II-fold pyridoxal phosphate-dependent enzyme n=1 Tax=Bacteroides ovatus TaxID=28116 RepID=UPI0022E20265|nr:pyridoxal phosphate-dependent aminotransferase family protein [Bacteroides ovatus]
MKYVISITKNKSSKDGSIMGKVLDFKDEMDLHEQSELNVYKKHPQLTACDREVTVYNRHTQQKVQAIMFGSNSYLGATIFPEAIQKAVEVTKEIGIGSGGVPLLTGTFIYQEELEHLVAKISGMDDSILFSSGYTANLGVISGLIRANNLIIHDKLDHASLLDGTVMSGAKMMRYKHGDVNHLESLLKDNAPKYPNGILVVTDGVFSMDGDIAKLPLILEITKKYNAILLIDEAHATGVIGDKGAGTLSHYGITDRKNIILTGTLSKAIGTVGGYITASQDIIDYLRIYARSNMFSASLPPSVCAAAIEVIKVMQNTNVVERLKQNAEYLQNKFRGGGFNILNTETPIVPLVVGDQAILTQMTKDAFDNGFIINSIFPPVVPANLTRFRISIMASHTQKDMDMLFDLIIKLFEKYDIPRFAK